MNSSADTYRCVYRTTYWLGLNAQATFCIITNTRMHRCTDVKENEIYSPSIDGEQHIYSQRAYFMGSRQIMSDLILFDSHLLHRTDEIKITHKLAKNVLWSNVFRSNAHSPWNVFLMNEKKTSEKCWIFRLVESKIYHLCLVWIISIKISINLENIKFDRIVWCTKTNATQ